MRRCARRKGRDRAARPELALFLERFAQVVRERLDVDGRDSRFPLKHGHLLHVRLCGAPRPVKSHSPRAASGLRLPIWLFWLSAGVPCAWLWKKPSFCQTLATASRRPGGTPMSLLRNIVVDLARDSDIQRMTRAARLASTVLLVCVGYYAGGSPGDPTRVPALWHRRHLALYRHPPGGVASRAGTALVGISARCRSYAPAPRRALSAA